MSEDAGAQALRAIGGHVVECPGESGRDVVRRLMLKGETKGDCEERKPGASPERDRSEIGIDQKAQQESAPEKLLHDRDNDHGASEPQREIEEIRRPGAEKAGIEAGKARRTTEEPLWGDPNGERDETDRNRPRATFWPKLRIPPAIVQQEKTGYYDLERKDPIVGRCKHPK